MYNGKSYFLTILKLRARNYRPCFRENKPKRSFSIKWKRAFWACFRENWVYKFGHRTHSKNHRIVPLNIHPALNCFAPPLGLIDFSLLGRYVTYRTRYSYTTLNKVTGPEHWQNVRSCYQILWWGREERLANHFRIDVSRTVGPAWKVIEF